MSMFRPTATQSLGDLVKIQREELQKKDSVIKALADALEAARDWVHEAKTREQVDAALRLAGRL